jgi:hypothetical protein
MEAGRVSSEDRHNRSSALGFDREEEWEVMQSRW